MSSNLLAITTYLLFFFSAQVQGEIYQWVDSQGRVQFSDRPTEDYDAMGYTRQSSSQQATEASGFRSPEDLEAIAEKLKKDRFKREKLRKKATRARVKKNEKREKRLATAEKRKLDCQKARDNEDLAFRQRIKSQSLIKMRKALANHVKKSETRRKKCSK
ncbi:hypothetical protein OLEAN_C13050 [Oleispira antarctica RB-8]|uniref:DUF4124 domain-containing protein n=1 Tax=Oleispira antarctica RB-8 TaxID=698738 RepID=R4YLB6_OLEAN|nr:hypothetical protein OLEAN_C13050 [Oleispira antarctica RB-8]